jgi:hypothetical protein
MYFYRLTFIANHCVILFCIIKTLTSTMMQINKQIQLKDNALN